jgi:prepilin-type N-terminal cleavage/methylation domain-containing protein
MTRAFTLIEISIGLVILSLLAAGGLTVGGVMVEQQQYGGSIERVAEAKKALADYFSVNGRLPCPASRTDLPNTTNFGVEVNCAAGGAAPAGTARVNGGGNFTGAAYSAGVMRIGALPVRSLGLRDSAMADEYGDRILYAMSEQFANPALIPAAKGEITLLDAGGNAIATAGAANGAVFLVVSHGPDGKGAYRMLTGAVKAACSGGALDTENCDDNNSFRDTRFNNGAGSGSFFDDMVGWSPKYLITTSSASTTAGGTNGQVQFNNNGFLGGAANFYWDTANNRVGIGTNAPDSVLEVVNDNSGIDRQDDVSILSYANTTTPAFLTSRARGTKASPQPLLNGDPFGIYVGFGYNGTSFIHGSSIQFIAENDWTSTATTNNASILFYNARSGVPTERMRITSDGKVGIGTSSPSDKLSIVAEAGITALSARKNSTNTTDFTAIFGVNGGPWGLLINPSSSSGAYSPLAQANDTTLIYSGGFVDTGGLVLGQWSNTMRGIRIAPSGNTGIGTSNPQAKLDVAGESRIGSTGVACSGANEGAQRYNSTSKIMEFCNGTSWAAMGGGGLVSYGGSFFEGTGYYPGCLTPNLVTGNCSCPAGYSVRLVAKGIWYSYSPGDSTFYGYTCEKYP